MPRLVILLSPPRSFSSVVSTMIGEHPDLYGFPELHLFVGNTLQEVNEIEKKRNPRHTAGPPGLLRAVAQLHDGVQTNGTIFRAMGWLNERRDWTCKQMMDHLLDAVAPKMGLEKTPATSQRMQYLERAYACYPDAYFLHLTRHPVSTRASWSEFMEHRTEIGAEGGWRQHVDRFVGWYVIHSNILKFTSSLPLGQSLRVKGEDILSEPDVYLPQIAEWLGIRTDREAIEAMKHPENSPYACMGPEAARWGNDPKFMRSPKLRSGRVREPSLAEFFEKEKPAWFPEDAELMEACRRSGLRIAPDERIIDEISELAHQLGYT
jgi:hypothetical protein